MDIIRVGGGIICLSSSMISSINSASSTQVLCSLCNQVVSMYTSHRLSISIHEHDVWMTGAVRLYLFIRSEKEFIHLISQVWIEDFWEMSLSTRLRHDTIHRTHTITTLATCSTHSDSSCGIFMRFGCASTSMTYKQHIICALTASIINTNSSLSFNQSLLWFQREIRLSNSSLGVKLLSSLALVASPRKVSSSLFRAGSWAVVLYARFYYSTKPSFVFPRLPKLHSAHILALYVECPLPIKSTGWQAVPTFLKCNFTTSS